MNVDVDVALTVLAIGCYRWLGRHLHGFDKAGPKQLYRKFVERAGSVEVQARRVVIHFAKRSTTRSCVKRAWTGTVIRSPGSTAFP